MVDDDWKQGFLLVEWAIIEAIIVFYKLNTVFILLGNFSYSSSENL